MKKLGRPPLPPERRRSVRISVAVTEDVGNGLYDYANRQRMDLSVVLSRLFERLVKREQELGVYRNRQNELTSTR